MSIARRIISLAVSLAIAVCGILPAAAERIPTRTVNTSWDFETQEDFDSWTLIDNDGDGRNWYWVHDAEDAEWWLTPYSGDGAAYSVSFVYNDSGYGGHQIEPDNFMISPELVGATYLSFWMRADDTDEYYDDDPVGVYAIDDQGNYEMLACYTTWYTWEQHVVDLSAFQGQNIRVALRHFNTTDMGFAVIIDLIETDGIPGDTEPYSLGDVDMNGVINAADAMLTLRHAMSLITLNESQQQLADIDRNGVVDFSDGTRIMRAALGLA